MVINWDIFPFSFSAALGKQTNITLQIGFSALELCSKQAWGDFCEKVSGNMPWNISRDLLKCVAYNKKIKTALPGSKENRPNWRTVIALVLN